MQTLLRQPRTTINELAVAVGINPISVRHHLTNLQVEGLVSTDEERHGVGRPRLVYFLTEAGTERFPTRYLRLTTRLLAQMKESMPEPVVSKLFAQMADGLAEEYAEPDEGPEHGRTARSGQNPADRGRFRYPVGENRRAIPDPRDHLPLPADRPEPPGSLHGGPDAHLQDAGRAGRKSPVPVARGRALHLRGPGGGHGEMSDAPVIPIHWEIHDTHPELVEPLRAKLAEIVDPEIALNVIQLGLIRKVSIAGQGSQDVCFADHAVLPVWPGHAGNDQAKSHRSA